MPAALEKFDRALASRRAFGLALAGIAVLAGLVRWAYYTQLSTTFGFGRLIVDCAGYDRQARGVLSGEWPGNQVFYQDALYPFALAAQYAVAGPDPTRAFVTQMVIGVASALLVAALAALVFGRVEAVIAGVLAATYGAFLFYEGLILKTSLAVFFVAATLVALVWSRRRASPWSLLAGVALGASCLLRGNLLALLPLGAVWYLWPRDEERARARFARCALFVLGTAAAIAPVTLHNVRAGHFVLITSQAGQNFYIGNSPINDTGTYVPPPGVRANPLYEQADMKRVAEADVGRALTPPEASEYWFGKAREFLVESPGAAARLTWKKFLLFFNHVEVPDNADYGATAAEVPLLRFTPAFSVVLVLAAIALALSRWTGELALVVAVAATMAATVIGFYVFSRYRLTIVPVLIVLAAALPRALATAVAAGSRARLGLALGAGALAALVTYQDAFDVSRTMYHYNLAIWALDDDDAARALAFLDESLREDEENWRAHALRGEVLDMLARGDEAGVAYARSIELAPGQAEPRYLLARHLAARNDLAGAIAAYEASLARERDDDVAEELADLYRRVGRTDDALRVLADLLARSPDDAGALAIHGALLLQERDYAGAERSLARAVASLRGNVRVRLNLARALAQQGKADAAREQYAAVLKRQPDNREAARGLAALDESE